MSNKYRAEQYFCISASEIGTEIELQMVVEFTVHPGSKATEIDPPEMPSAEVDQVQFFEVKQGKPSPNPATMPVWMISRFTDGNDFHDWLLSEADDQLSAAQDEYADQRREMIQEDRL